MIKRRCLAVIISALALSLGTIAPAEAKPEAGEITPASCAASGGVYTEDKTTRTCTTTTSVPGTISHDAGNANYVASQRIEFVDTTTTTLSQGKKKSSPVTVTTTTDRIFISDVRTCYRYVGGAGFVDPSECAGLYIEDTD